MTDHPCLGPSDLQDEARKLATNSQLLQTFVAYIISANGSRLTSEQANALYEALDFDSFVFDVVFALIANTNTAIGRADLEAVYPRPYARSCIIKLPRIMLERGIADRPLTFGRYKGVLLSKINPEYIRWIAEHSDTMAAPARHFVADARAIAHALDAETAAEQHARSVFRGSVASGKDHPVYVIERNGDLDGLSLHNSISDALTALGREFPVERGVRSTPDPENDRILIWEILPTGHRKVV